MVFYDYKSVTIQWTVGQEEKERRKFTDREEVEINSREEPSEIRELLIIRIDHTDKRKG